jgi:prolyl oligopeptidase PreP (S9A serine peptidase family)
MFNVSVANTANCYYVFFFTRCQCKCLLQVFREIKIQDFDASQYDTEQVFYESKDGTKIPMFIVHKRVSNIILILSEQS